MAKTNFNFKLKKFGFDWNVEVTRKGSYRGSGNAYYEFVFTNPDYTITDQMLADHNDFYFTAKTVRAEADEYLNNYYMEREEELREAYA